MSKDNKHEHSTIHEVAFFSIYTEYKLEMKINLIDQSCLYLI